MTEEITPLILTYNEAPNICRTLEQLSWAKQILIVDSFSNDETLNIARQHPQVTVIQRKFDSFASQCNFGIQNITTAWVLSLDADFVLSNELVKEINHLNLDNGIDAFAASFKYCVFGKPLHGTLYPPRTVLYRRDKAHYHDDGHSHRVKVEGKKGELRSHILHDDRKSFTRWIQSQDRYMILEAQKLIETPTDQLSRADRIRKTKFFAPFFVFLYCLFAKKAILDGWRGWYYTLQRVVAEVILCLILIEKHLEKP